MRETGTYCRGPEVAHIETDSEEHAGANPKRLAFLTAAVFPVLIKVRIPMRYGINVFANWLESVVMAAGLERRSTGSVHLIDRFRPEWASIHYHV